MNPELILTFMSSLSQAPIPQPLNLPNGSVRAAMALLISATLWLVVLRGNTPPPVLVDAATLVVIFYFAVRLTGGLTLIPQPPRKHRYFHASIRLFLFLGFFTVAVYLYRQGLPTNYLGRIIPVLEGYSLGYASTLIIHRVHHNLPRPGLLFWHHGKAVAVLTVTAALCSLFFITPPSWVPSYTENLLGPTVSFYFGSRSY